MLPSIVRRVVNSALAQSTKTIARPSRLFVVPYNYVTSFCRNLAERLIARFPWLVPLVLPMLPIRWMSNGVGKAFCNTIGYDLFQHDHPVEAWQCLDRSISAGRATTDEYLMGAMCLYHGLGRFRDAMSLLARANELGLAEVDRRDLGNVSVRVLDNVWARHIGHTATLDYVIRLGILEGRDRNGTILVLPPGSKVANRFLLQQVSAHLRVVESPAELPFDVSAVQALHFDYLGPRLPDRTTRYFWDLAGETYVRWREQGRPPLLSLPPEVRDRGWGTLHAAGVPQGAWFVALHVREGTWDGRNAGMHGVLNADIASYTPAIAEITRRGGWVIRMGDPGMRPLAPLPNVIDYCHSNMRADWMDIFIATQCRFLLGTSSGPAVIPGVYGVPMLLTNWWPPAQRPWHASDIFIPKMIRRQADGRYLVLDETLTEPFSYCHSRRYLAEHERVEVEDSDPGIIKAAVEEMLARLDGNDDNTEIISLCGRADQIYKSHGVAGMGQLASSFLRRYENFVA
jgi:putative glycosyltransferase (TIGR04372 family)